MGGGSTGSTAPGGVCGPSYAFTTAKARSVLIRRRIFIIVADSMAVKSPRTLK